MNKNMIESHIVEQMKPDTKDIVWFHLYGILNQAKIIYGARSQKSDYLRSGC